MTTTLEKMVAAMAALPVRDLSEPGGELDKLRLREVARAALEAIREPSPDMCVKGGIAIYDEKPNAYTAVDEAAACHRAMIDEILAQLNQAPLA